MEFCKLPPGMEKFVEKAINSGKYYMTGEKLERFAKQASSALGIELDPNLTVNDVKPQKYDVPLSKAIRDYRTEKYE